MLVCIRREVVRGVGELAVLLCAPYDNDAFGIINGVFQHPNMESMLECLLGPFQLKLVK